MMRKLFALFLLGTLSIFTQDVFAQNCPDYSNTINITWPQDPGTYYRAAGTPARGRVQVSGGTVVADNGQRLRGTFALILPSWTQEWSYVTSDEYFSDMVTKRHYNVIRAFCYGSGTNYIAPATVVGYLRTLVDKAAQWGVYVMINPQTSYIGGDTVKWNGWWDIVAPAFKDDANVFYADVDEPTGDRDGDGHYGTWNDWLSSEVSYQVSLYTRMRALAPSTLIVVYENMLFDYTLATKSPKAVIDLGQTYGAGIDYTNAAVGWHAYPYIDVGSTDMSYYDTLKAHYPIFMTSYTTLDPITYPYGTGNFGPGADTMEAHGISWIELKGFPWYAPHDPVVDTYVPQTSNAYYVNQTGSDSYAGTFAAPWKTLTHAAATIASGDTVYVLNGTYTETGWAPPSNSTWLAYTGHRPTLHVTSGAALTVNTKSNIVVQGFLFDHCYFPIDVESSTSITVRQCRIDSMTALYTDQFRAALFKNSDSVRFIRDTLDLRQELLNDYLSASYCARDGVGFWTCNYSVVDSCEFSGAGHYNISFVYGGRMNVMQNSRSHDGHGLFSFGTHNRGLLQYCQFDSQYTYESRAGSMVHIKGDTCIVRYVTCNNNVDNGRDPASGEQWSAVMDFFSEDGQVVKYNHIYNVTVKGQNSTHSQKKLFERRDGSVAGSYIDNNIIKNSIFWTGCSGQYLFEWTRPYTDYTTFTNFTDSVSTCYMRHTNIGDSWFRWYVGGGGGNMATETLAQIIARGGAVESNNSEADVHLQSDLSIDGTSPAIDAAAPETWVASGTTGTSIALNDAGYFFAGIAGYVAADSIKIGSNSPVAITAISGNTVTISTSQTVSANDPVYYYKASKFSGTAPDIGNYEYVASSGTPGSSGKMLILRTNP